MTKVNDIDYDIELHHGILFGSTEFNNDWGATVLAYPRWPVDKTDKRIKYDFDVAKIAIAINDVVDWEDDLNEGDANEYLALIAASPKCEL